MSALRPALPIVMQSTPSTGTLVLTLPRTGGEVRVPRVANRRQHASAGKTLVSRAEGGVARAILDNPLQLVVLATLLAAALGLCGRRGRARLAPRPPPSTVPI